MQEKHESGDHKWSNPQSETQIPYVFPLEVVQNCLECRGSIVWEEKGDLDKKGRVTGEDNKCMHMIKYIICTYEAVSEIQHVIHLQMLIKVK